MEPKPCPFHTAQSKNEAVPVQYLYAVLCDLCLAMGPLAKTKELAVTEWNTRAGSEYQAEIDALRLELKQLRDTSS